MNLHRSLLIFLIFAFATEIGYGQSQPTSLSLSASQGYAGVDSYTITVGDAAGMTVDFEFSYGGSTGTFFSTLGSSGTNGVVTFKVDHDTALGTYTYLRMRNHALTEWVDPPDVTYLVLPPQPTSLSISPTAVTAGQGFYTITVGNGADINLEIQYQRNGVNQPQYIWGTLDPVPGSPADGQGAATVGPCVIPGVYTFTALRNYLNVPWVAVNSSVTINPATGYSTPPSGSASPSSGLQGTAVAVTIVGSHLCDAVLSTSWPGLWFSSVTTAHDGNSVNAIFNVASNATLGQAVVTLTSASGSMNFNFNEPSGTIKRKNADGSVTVEGSAKWFDAAAAERGQNAVGFLNFGLSVMTANAASEAVGAFVAAPLLSKAGSAIASLLGRGGAQETTTLFRAVSQAEFDSTLKAGSFAAGPNSLGGKFFAENAADAAKWGERLNGPGNFQILRTELPKDAAGSLMRWERLDGIGPARYGELNQINIPGMKVGGQ